MAEGPQVLLLTERLRQWLLGRIPLAITTVRDALTDGCSDAVEHPIVQIVCHGKHIFICFDNQSVLHNHLLMRGRWRKYGGGLLILPEDAWLSIDVGELTVCNLKGQVLEWISRARMHTIVNSLGPDAMTRPYPLGKIENRLDASGHPVSESLLDQSLLAGIGNTAKSEILFSAGIDPRKPTNTLTPRERERLHEQIQNILWESSIGEAGGYTVSTGKVVSLARSATHRSLSCGCRRQTGRLTTVLRARQSSIPHPSRLGVRCQ